MQTYYINCRCPRNASKTSWFSPIWHHHTPQKSFEPPAVPTLTLATRMIGWGFQAPPKDIRPYNPRCLVSTVNWKIPRDLTKSTASSETWLHDTGLSHEKKNVEMYVYNTVYIYINIMWNAVWLIGTFSQFSWLISRTYIYMGWFHHHYKAKGQIINANASYNTNNWGFFDPAHMVCWDALLFTPLRIWSIRGEMVARPVGFLRSCQESHCEEKLFIPDTKMHL